MWLYMPLQACFEVENWNPPYLAAIHDDVFLQNASLHTYTNKKAASL